MTKLCCVYSLFCFLLGLFLVESNERTNNGDLVFGHGSNLLSALHVPKDLFGKHLRVKKLPPIASSVGWVYALAFKGPSCTGSADITAGIITNACLAPNASSPTSYLITCSQRKCFNIDSKVCLIVGRVPLYSFGNCGCL